MATNGPIPMKLTVVDDGGSKVISSTRVNPLANHCIKSNAGPSTSEKLSPEGLITRNNFANASMEIESKPNSLGILPSVVDTGTIFMVNSVPNPVEKTPSKQDVVFVPLQPPLSGVQQFDLATLQKRMQATSGNKLLLPGNNAPTVTQTSLGQNVAEVQNKFLRHHNQIYHEKGNVPIVTRTLKQNLLQSPRPVFSTVKEQLSVLRQQPLSDARNLLRHIILKRGNGPVPSSPNSSRPDELATSLPKPQQNCVVVKHIPNLLSNNRVKPMKQLSDVDRNSIVKQSNTSINVLSATKRGGNQPVFVVKPPHLSPETVKQSNSFYLVSSPHHHPTLVPVSLLGPSIPSLFSNRHSLSTSGKGSQTQVGQVSHPHTSPKTWAANTPVVQVKRTLDQEQGSMHQPNKKSKSTNSSEIYIKKEPQDNSEDALSNMDTQTIVQHPLSKHYLSPVSDLPRDNQVDDVGKSSSGSGNDRLLGNCLNRTETISMKSKVSTPPCGTSPTIVTSNQVSRRAVATSNVASPPATSSMSQFIYQTHNKQTFGKETANNKQTMPMKTFIVTDKSGTTRLLKVPASTPASHMLYSISNHCKYKKLTLATPQPKGRTNSSETSTGGVVVVKKVDVGAKQGEQGSLKTDAKGGGDLTRGRSKSDSTNYVGVKEGTQGSLTTEKMSKGDAKCSVDVKKRGLKKSPEGNDGIESSIIVTRSKTRNRKRVLRKRKRKEKDSAFCVKRRVKRKRHTKSYEAKVQIHDHNYAFQPDSCKAPSEDKSKMTFKELMDGQSVDSENTKDFSSFEKQLTEVESAILPERVHIPEKKIKVTLPIVALKPLKLHPEDHLKRTVVLSEALLAEVSQLETKGTSHGNIQDSFKDSDQNSDLLNFKGCLEVRKAHQKLSDSSELGNKGAVLPQKMPESIKISMSGKVKLEPEISVKCEDELLQTSEETTHLEEQSEAMMEIPSDLSLMSGKDRIKILRERMRRREREIEALVRKNVKPDSVV